MLPFAKRARSVCPRSIEEAWHDTFVEILHVSTTKFWRVAGHKNWFYILMSLQNYFSPLVKKPPKLAKYYHRMFYMRVLEF